MDNMEKFDHLLAKSEKNGKVTLVQHLKDVATIAERVAANMGLNATLAYGGGLLHDIGKTSPLFQATLKSGYKRPPNFIFRHEIASLFFLSLIEDVHQPAIIDMIVAHHKSVKKDAGEKGLLDLDGNYAEGECFKKHAEQFKEWVPEALELLSALGMPVKPIAIEQAYSNYQKAVAHCEAKKYGYNQWKGVLMAADHLASAMESGVQKIVAKLFIQPDLKFYNRIHELYPLSQISVEDNRIHTIVTAPTGAGKTDFLIRRCKGRVFYTLPFQASINAMYDRIRNDLKDTDAAIYLLHAASALKMEGKTFEEKILQRHIGASIKVLTPHQMASLVFGTKGYEVLIVDVANCDIILDEIHTYSDTIQAIVLKIVEVLCSLGCRVHIGTATMPTVLYNRLLEILGGKEKVYEVQLPDNVLHTFNRHIVHKAESFETMQPVIEDAISNNKKILIVCNRVSKAQDLYKALEEDYPFVKKMLIHSRFKRGRRSELEHLLKNEYNESKEACIVVSTQVVEVSLDISFDIMITECAPIDALIQRFGRVHRKRTLQTIGTYKPVYVLQPTSDENEAKPYSLPVLQKSYEVLPGGEVLQENKLQQMIDEVYPAVSYTFGNIDLNTVFSNGKWRLKELWHYPKSALLEALDIDAVTCIEECDVEKYESSVCSEQAKLEIPVSYKSVAFKKLDTLKTGSRPFIVPSKAYDDDCGLDATLIKAELYDVAFRML